ncbi:MAG: STT3 domain-containing protein, partial [Bilophila sp.]
MTTKALSCRTVPLGPVPRWLLGVLLGVLTYAAAFGLRLLEWPSWQEVEFRLGNEMLLATHDAYHWLAGAEGFEFGTGHPMSELLRILALLVGTDPAQVAFWLPPVMASFVALLVFAWAWSMGSMEAGFCAGVLASLAPGFLARTLFGYADTDLVTLFLPLLISLAPGCWVMAYLRHPLALPFLWTQRWTKRPVPIALDAPGHLPHRL